MKKMKLNRAAAGRPNTIPLHRPTEYYDGTGALKQPEHIGQIIRPVTEIFAMPDRDERLHRLFSGK